MRRNFRNVIISRSIINTTGKSDVRESERKKHKNRFDQRFLINSRPVVFVFNFDNNSAQLLGIDFVNHQRFDAEDSTILKPIEFHQNSPVMIACLVSSLFIPTLCAICIRTIKDCRAELAKKKEVARDQAEIDALEERINGLVQVVNAASNEINVPVDLDGNLEKQEQTLLPDKNPKLGNQVVDSCANVLKRAAIYPSELTK